ncbi:type IV secretion system protein [Bartonella taylorii]|uniref:Conjugal transfer protein n=1 Tax=Bartonella taylorii TaxID=33046 RepID=A0A9Q9DLR0_BARTA|nr:type IV secretion system protein [Bartonella taylorii]USP02379.1 conjugal transfer protein [Bartonella taylorii]
MKKVIILVTIAAVFGTTNSAKSWTWGAGAVDLSATVPSWPNFPWSSSKKASPKKSSPPQHYIELIDLIKQQLEVNKKQFEQAQKTHSSITENRKFATKELKTIQTDHTSFFLKDPHLVYNKISSSTITPSLTKILQEERIFNSNHESRDSIGERIQYAAVIDKAVSLQTFQEAEKRFKKISELVEQIDTTVDLKGIAELQARMKGMLAMIQNETAKLQMVAHSRNAEQALIGQQKQKRNMKILNSKNREMPIIRSIR